MNACEWNDPKARELEDPPDAVTFSKKMQVAGYYTKPDLVPELPYRVFNTWMGDPSKVLMLEAVLDCVEKDGLVENAAVTGDYLQRGLQTLAREPTDDRPFNTTHLVR